MYWQGIAASTVGALYFVMRAVVPIDKMHTPAATDIDRWTASGAHSTHMPGVATKLGM